MLKKLCPLVLALLLILSACGGQESAGAPADDTGLSVVATTYPVYLLADAVIGEEAGVNLALMIDQSISCLHDYTLSVENMRLLDGADAVLLSGAGLEDFLDDALAAAGDLVQVDCSQGVDLLPSQEDPGESDPHYWMDPARACQMVENLAQGLSQLLPESANAFAANAQAAQDAILDAYAQEQEALADLSCRELITFHDGFSYFAEAFDLTILRAIEEESGSEASAQEVSQILQEVESHNLPAIFTEKNGSDSTAQVIQRESGVAIYQLDLLMSGDKDTDGLAAYIAGMDANVAVIQEACA
ncbi:MAG: metal ABC transporter substrate-binding protein [Evtepia sp.]|nr:metal ABC transporter substrate-binding protein [Evtepia sp.]